MIKYLSILYIIFLSCFLFEFLISEIWHLIVGEIFPFNLKNILSNSISTSFIFAIDSKVRLIDDTPKINDTNTFSTEGLLSSVLFPNYDINGSFDPEKDDVFNNGTIANI